jgi:hypothetical protein
MITYHWTITKMLTFPLPQEPNFVVLVDYTVAGTDGTYTAVCENTAKFPQDPNQPDYIPYRDLTEEIVLGWIQASLEPTTYDSIYGNIAGQINDQKNPPPSPEPKPLPWVI